MSEHQPFMPEPIDALRARLPDALRDVYDVRVLVKHPNLTPGKKRAHVFDCDDGLRLIVSMDDLGQGPVIHVSASVPDGSSTLAREARHHIDNLPQWFARSVIERLVELDPRLAGQVKLCGVTPKGVFHFVSDPVRELN